jgi:hypothetical protein
VQCLTPLSFLVDPCNECWPMTPKPDDLRALDVETSLRGSLLKSKRLRSQTSHTINQIEFFIFLREHSMLSEARGPVTQWELKLMILLIFFFNLSQGLINKSSYKSQDTHSSIQISYLTEPMLMCLWEIIQTSEISLIQQVSQKIQISNDM